MYSPSVCRSASLSLEAIPSRHSVLYGMLATSLYSGLPLIADRWMEIMVDRTVYFGYIMTLYRAHLAVLST